jgi:hypothetical protein
MLKDTENKILTFTNELGGITRTEIVHGTLYIKLERDSDCDYIHREIRNHYREFINPEGGVNMYAVGDEFAFDFVPEDRETPVFTDEKDNHKGVDMEALTDDITEDAMNDMPSEVDIALNLEADSKEGR